MSKVYPHWPARISAPLDKQSIEVDDEAAGCAKVHVR